MNLFRAAGMVVWAVRSAAACALRGRIWLPFLAIAGVQTLALVLVLNFHQPYLSPFVAPIVTGLGQGSAATHYPNFYLELPIVFARLSLILSILVTCIMIGAASILFAQAFGRVPHLNAWKAARKRYPALLIATLILAVALFAIPYLANLFPRDVMLRNSVVRWGARGILLFLSVLTQSFLIYAAAWILLRNERVFAAVADSFRLTRATFLPTFVVVALPALALYPLSFLDSRGDLFINKFRPEAVTGLILLQIGLEILLAFLLVGAITRIFIYQTEEAS